MNSSLLLHQPGFVPANARLLAAASQAAYRSGPSGPASSRSLAPQAPECARLGRSDAETTAGAGLTCAQMDHLPLLQSSAPNPPTLACVNPSTGTHLTVTTYDDCTVIAFRGTASLRDWLTDAEFPLRPLPGSPARVHEGFLHAVESVLGDLQARVGQASSLPLQPNGNRLEASSTLRPILLTGHSLGGALAVLAAWFLQEQGLPVHSVYTFGQPRVGDAQFAAAYTSLLGAKTFRTVNQNDLVPRVPGVLLGYRHAGELAFINALGNLVLNPSLIGRLVSDALGLWRAYRRLDDVLITDHFMGNYVESLNRLQSCSVATLQSFSVAALPR